MIKICSLDYINKEKFDTDVMSEDGRVLCRVGEKVTPQVLLKLYFKDIYIAQEQPEEQSMMMFAETIDEKSNNQMAFNQDNTDETITSGPVLLKVAEDENTIQEEKIKVSGPKKADGFDIDDQKSSSTSGSADGLNLDSDESNASGPRRADEPNLDVEESNVSGPRIADEPDLDAEKSNVSGPRIADELTFDANDSNVLDSKKDGANLSSEENTKNFGPRFAEIDLSESEKETNTSGPRRAEIDFDEVNSSKIESKSVSHQNVETSQEQVQQENPNLQFDGKKAKKIVEYSVNLAKILNYTSNEVKELEQVAYYYNYGIDKFKKTDVSKHNFRKVKAYASYEKLLEEGIVSDRVAEIVKLCGNNYESEGFPLSTKPPYHHIVAITGFYEDSLAQNRTKDETLLKMLQMGGNNFNIFVLHKFIRIMRDSNE